MSEAIKEALQKLDPENDEHWTYKGFPRVDVVANLSGVLALTRSDLVEVAPDFNRESARTISSSAAENTVSTIPSHSSPAEAEQAPASANFLAEDIPTVEQAKQMDRDRRKEIKLTELEAVRKHMGELQQQEHRLIAELDVLISQELREEGPHSNQKAIMDWINGQLEERRKRAERQNQLLEKGVAPHELAERKAPIDQAMARGMGYGMDRPKYPRWKPPK